MWIVVWLIIDACLAILPASIAERKGKSFGVWYLYGFLIWIVAVLHAISLPEKQESTSSSSIKNSNNSTESIQINSVSSVNFVTCEDVDINAKVRIKGIEIEKDNNENVYLKLTVFNVTTDPISALNLCIEGYNSFGNPVLVNGEESFSLIVQDLYLRPKFLESIKRVMLPNLEIRKVKVNIKQICYSDGTIEELKEPKMVKSCQEPLDTQYLAYAQRTVSNLARYHMIESDEYWQCVCGEINTENVCMSCRTSKEEARKYAKENIENGYQQFLIQREEEKREGEKRAQEEEVKQQSEAVKKKKIVRLTGIGVIVSIVLVLGLISYLRTRKITVTKENYQPYIEMIGESVSSTGSIQIDPDLIDGLSHLEIMGIDGTITHGWDTIAGENIITSAEWKSNSEQTEKEYNDMKKLLNDCLDYVSDGEYFETLTDEECTVWSDVENDCQVVGWFQDGDIHLIWYGDFIL